MSNLAKYGDWTPEAARTEAADAEASDNEFMKLVVGRNVVRILPPKIGATSPFQVVYQHYVNVPGETSARVFACPRIMAKRACPACARADQLATTGNPADKDLSYQIQAKRRVFCNAVNRQRPEDGVKVLAFGKTVHEQLLALRDDEDVGGNFTHPESGFDVVIKRVGTTKNDTEYTVLPVKTSTPLGNDEWLETMRDLGKYAVAPTAEQLAKILKIEMSSIGGDGGNARSGRAAPGRAGKPRTAEDDADES